MLLIFHWLGLDNVSGFAYAFWSGFGSDLTEFAAAAAFLVGLAVSYRHKNCEVKGCWRLGRHATAAGHKVCRHHHPDDHLTVQDIHDAHHAALGTAPPAKGTLP